MGRVHERRVTFFSPDEPSRQDETNAVAHAVESPLQHLVQLPSPEANFMPVRLVTVKLVIQGLEKGVESHQIKPIWREITTEFWTN